MGLLHNGFSHDGEHPTNINAVLIYRKRIYALYHNAKVLLQFLKQRDIHLRVIIPQADHIALCRRFSDHFDGQQDNWGITGLGAALILKPPQHTQSKV